MGIFKTCHERLAAEAVLIGEIGKDSPIVINNKSETQFKPVSRRNARLDVETKESDRDMIEEEGEIAKMVRKRKERGRGRPKKARNEITDESGEREPIQRGVTLRPRRT